MPGAPQKRHTPARPRAALAAVLRQPILNTNKAQHRDEAALPQTRARSDAPASPASASGPARPTTHSKPSARAPIGSEGTTPTSLSMCSEMRIRVSQQPKPAAVRHCHAADSGQRGGRDHQPGKPTGARKRRSETAFTAIPAAWSTATAGLAGNCSPPTWASVGSPHGGPPPARIDRRHRSDHVIDSHTGELDETAERLPHAPASLTSANDPHRDARRPGDARPTCRSDPLGERSAARARASATPPGPRQAPATPDQLPTAVQAPRPPRAAARRPRPLIPQTRDRPAKAITASPGRTGPPAHA
jgi:hypothetical protein